MSEEGKIDVEAILSTKQSQYKSTDVDKDVDVELDIGNLLATDTNILKSDELKLVTSKSYYGPAVVKILPLRKLVFIKYMKNLLLLLLNSFTPRGLVTCTDDALCGK